MIKSGTNILKKDQEIGINFQRSYVLPIDYISTKSRALQKLAKYLDSPQYPDFVTFDDTVQTITYTTERLIPPARTGHPRVMLLFSNPHPHSIRQGMFLSPNTHGQENLFWPVMKEAGWIKVESARPEPKALAEICLNVTYEGPFELLFYTYYAFPTDYPEDIRTIFGKEFFQQQIAPEAAREFAETIQSSGVQAVVAFNKGVFNLVAEDPVDRPIEKLKVNDLKQSKVKDIDKVLPIYLTFPTGWRYAKDYLSLRTSSLEKIKASICDRAGGQAK